MSSRAEDVGEFEFRELYDYNHAPAPAASDKQKQVEPHATNGVVVPHPSFPRLPLLTPDSSAKRIQYQKK